MISLFVVICCILFIFLNSINNTFILNVCIILQSCFVLCPIQVKNCKCCSTCKYTLYIEEVFLPISCIYSLCFRELSNAGEAELVSQLTLGLLEKLGNQQLSIGIITPYQKQRAMIVSILHSRQVISMIPVLCGEKILML
jgi:hypothetical protein